MLFADNQELYEEKAWVVWRKDTRIAYIFMFITKALGISACALLES